MKIKIKQKIDEYRVKNWNFSYILDEFFKGFEQSRWERCLNRGFRGFRIRFQKLERCFKYNKFVTSWLRVQYLVYSTRIRTEGNNYCSIFNKFLLFHYYSIIEFNVGLILTSVQVLTLGTLFC